MTTFIEELNPDIMAQELMELTGMDMDEVRYESFGYDCLTPEEKGELEEWFNSVDSEVELPEEWSLFKAN